MKRLLPIAVAAALVASCVPDDGTVDVALEPGADGELVPGAPASDEGTRDRRRMDLAQLNASIRQVTGGVGWTEFDSQGNEIDLFEELSATLGEPDWINRTTEDLEPSLIFEKFLGDAARDVCSTTVGRELALPNQPRVIMVHAGEETTWAEDPAAIEENLAYLLLRFHGRKVAPGDARLDPWRWLFESAEHTGSSPARAWTAVCVALIQHPDFHTQ